MVDKSKDWPAEARARDRRPEARPARGAIGSTLLGILIGMAIGLAIAVAVAVYVTRAPVPFVNKQGRVGQAIEAARAGGSLPDPNKPLAGKSREAGSPDTIASDTNSILSIFRDAPPVPPGAQSAPARTERAAPPVPPAAVAPPRAPEPARGDSSNYPNLSSGLPAAAGSAPEARAPSGYVLQAGAFRGQGDADTMKAKLALLGFEARVLPAETEGRPIFRVRVGPYGQIEDMNRAREKLAENGIEATVIRQR